MFFLVSYVRIMVLSDSSHIVKLQTIYHNEKGKTFSKILT